jgi:O-antigen ligase
MLLAAILCWGILTLWVPGRWALAAFQVALFAFAAVRLARRPLRIHPVGGLLAVAAAWGLVQILAGWTVEESVTVEAVLAWTANLAAFSLALDLYRDVERRERFLTGCAAFAGALSVICTLTAISSPEGRAFWWLDLGTDQPTLGPFVYRNQYAAFVESVLPLALVRAILDRRWVLWTLVTAALFGSVVAAGSRAGVVLGAAEIVLIPAVMFGRRMISGRTLARAVLGSLVTAGALAGVAGWETVWNRLQEPNPYALRRDLVLSSLEMIRDRPATGFGLGAWSSAYPSYARFDDGSFVNQAHNDWVQWGAEGGVPFLLVMLAVVSWSARPAIRSIWGIGLLVVFAHGLVDYPMQQRPALAAFFFAVLGAIFAADAGPNGRR